jgi:hypothetical protein
MLSEIHRTIISNQTQTALRRNTRRMGEFTIRTIIIRLRRFLTRIRTKTGRETSYGLGSIEQRKKSLRMSWAISFET